ncbi:MAG: RidA family protein [Gemmatimonadetes bacterium]|nr:RidA family protein [Gemmatimonadota bacterium]
MRLTVAALGLLLAAPLAAQDKQVIGQGPINPASPPRISPAIRVGNLLFASGQLGVRPARDSAGPGTTGEQTTRALENMKRIIEEGGTTMDRAVKCLVFLADIADFAQMNAAYSPFFPKDPPARSTVAVAALVNNARVEIECIFAMPAGAK